MVKIQQDILGNTPKVGDTIAFNPTGCKGLMSGVIQGFTKTGLPEIKPEEECGDWRGSWYPKQSEFGKVNKNGMYTPKTGFVIAKVCENLQTVSNEPEVVSNEFEIGSRYLIDNRGTVGIYKGVDKEGDLYFQLIENKNNYLVDSTGNAPFLKGVVLPEDKIS